MHLVKPFPRAVDKCAHHWIADSGVKAGSRASRGRSNAERLEHAVRKPHNRARRPARTPCFSQDSHDGSGTYFGSRFDY
jgi:hypothetical protein